MSDQKIMGPEMLKSYNIKEGLLTDIYKAQESFGKKFCDFESIRDGEDPNLFDHWVRVFSDCILDECSEVINWLPWKHWKDYSDFEINLEEIRFELIDILHFLTSQALLFKPIYIPFNINLLSDQDSILKNWVNIDFYGSLPIRERINTTLRSIRLLQYIASKAFIETRYNRSNIEEGFVILFRLFGIWGMTPQDIYNYYMSKNQENFDRQERGY